MRFFIYGVFLLAWMGVCWWTYTCHIKDACCVTVAAAEQPIAAEDITGPPLLFRWGEAEPILGPGFETYRDSIISAMGDNGMEITGHYFRDEPGAEDGALGLARASSVRNLFDSNLEGHLNLQSSVAGLTGDARNQLFEAVDFRILIRNEVVQELADRAVINFPYNSTAPLHSPEIDEYLETLVKRIDKTEEHIRLTGYTDNVGPNEDNYYLGLWRASAIEELLVNRGIPNDQIEVVSRGELDPMFSNTTSEGRRKNRRVELILVKPN